MTDPKKFALFGGILMLIVGLLSLVPNLYYASTALPQLNVEASYGYFLGVIPMNIFNKAALIVFGLLGIAAATWRHNSLPLSIKYSRLIMVVMGVLAIMGMFEQTNTFFGYAPLFESQIAVYGLLAILGGYFGYRLTSLVPHTYEKNASDARAHRTDDRAHHHFKMPHFGKH